MLDRIVARRGLHQPGQHRRLTFGQILRLAIEEMHTGRAQAVYVVAEIGVRQIAFEDLVLGQPAFQPERDQHFARLAGQRLFGRQEGELGELLRDGRSAAISGPGGTRDAARIDPPMRIEAPVLDSEKRLHDMGGERGDLHRIVHDRAVASDRRAVRRQQGDLRRDDGFQRFVQRRGDRQPGHQHDEQADRGGDDPNRPPPLAAIAPIGGPPPWQPAPLLAPHCLVDMAEPGIPFVIGRRTRVGPVRAEIVAILVIVVGIGAQPVMQRVIAAMRRGLDIPAPLAPEGIEKAHRLLC